MPTSSIKIQAVKRESYSLSAVLTAEQVIMTGTHGGGKRVTCFSGGVRRTAASSVLCETLAFVLGLMQPLSAFRLMDVAVVAGHQQLPS
eukprot:2063253-Amphidinium_carterae.2